MPRTRSNKTRSKGISSDPEVESDVTKQSKNINDCEKDKQGSILGTQDSNIKKPGNLFAATKLLIEKEIKTVPVCDIKNFNQERTTFPYNAYISTGVSNDGELTYEPGVVYAVSFSEKDLMSNKQKYPVKRQRRNDVLNELAREEQEMDRLNKGTNDLTTESSESQANKAAAKKKGGQKNVPLPVDELNITDILKTAQGKVGGMSNLDFGESVESEKNKALSKELKEKEDIINQLREELMMQKMVNSAVEVMPTRSPTKSIPSTDKEQLNEPCTTPKSSQPKQKSQLPARLQCTGNEKNQLHSLSTPSTSYSSSLNVSGIRNPGLPSIASLRNLSDLPSASGLASTVCVPGSSALPSFRRVAKVVDTVGKSSCSTLLGPGTSSNQNLSQISTDNNTVPSIGPHDSTLQLPSTKRQADSFKGNVSKRARVEKPVATKVTKTKQKYVKKKKVCMYDSDDWDNSDSEPANEKKRRLTKWIKEEKNDETGIIVKEEMFHLHFGVSVPYRAWKKALKSKSSSSFLRQICTPHIWSYEEFWHKAVQVEKTTSVDDREPFEPKKFEALKRAYTQYLSEKGFINAKPSTADEQKNADRKIAKFGRELGIIVSQARAVNQGTDDGKKDKDEDEEPLANSYEDGDDDDDSF